MEKRNFFAKISFTLVCLFLIYLSLTPLFNKISARVTEDCPCVPNDCSSQCSGCSWYTSRCEVPEPPIKDTEITNPIIPERLARMSGARFFNNFLNTGVLLGLVIGSIIFFFLLLTGAIRWISSGGDKTQLEGAQKQITHALIGLVILLSIFAIISLIESIFGISITTINLPTL